MKTNRFANFPWAEATLVFVVCLLLAANGIYASVIAAQYCPQFCECGLDKKGISWANCSRVLPERVRFPEVQRLTVVPDDGVALDENSVLHYIPIVFPKLKDLHVSRCGLTHLSHSRFKQLGSLREIDLSGNRLSEFSSHLFFSNQKLVYVNLENNPLKVRAGRPFLVSNSIVELDLSRCNLTVIAPDAFSALPSLKYLRLGHNRLTTVHSRLLPMSLSALDLSHNLIRTVPIAELMELKELREIDLSENPINCTCELIGFQNWISGQGVIFLNNIICSTPFSYHGWRLVDVPHYDLCEATLIENPAASLLSSSSVESCDEDHVCDNVIVPNARDLLSSGRNNRKRSSALDEGPDAIYENDEMLPVQKRASKRDSQNKPPPSSKEEDYEGSGDFVDSTIDSSEIPAANGIETTSVSSDPVESKPVVNSSPSESRPTEAAVKDEENDTVATIPATTQTEPEKSSPTDVVSPASGDTVEVSKSALDETRTETTAMPQTENEVKRMKIDDAASSTENPPKEPSSTENPPKEPSSTENPPKEPSSTENPPKEPSPIGNPPKEEPSPSENPPTESSSTENPPTEPSSSNTTADTESSIAKEPVAVKESDRAVLDATPSTEGAEPDTKKPSRETISTSEAAFVEQSVKPASNETDSYELNPHMTNSSATIEDPTTTTEAVNKTEGGDPFGQPHTGEQEQINLFGFGLTYIIPCIVVIAFMLVCVAVYASQRRKSFRKNWSLEDSNRQNEGGTELQDISLLPDAAKGNIVKRNKYPDETESEQTVRLMTPPSPDAADEQPNTAAPVWQSDSLPPSNGQIPPSSAGSEQPDSAGGPLPNGETLPKTAPIAEPEDVNENELQLTKAKVTVLQDSIPKTAVIINRNSTIDDAN